MRRFWFAFVRSLHQPTDGASLALFRIFFGYMLLHDTLRERGFPHSVEARWASEYYACSFPLFHSWQIPSPDVFYVIGGAMTVACLFISIGLFTRISLAIYAVLAWYVHSLNTLNLNNHAYLFATIATVMIPMDSHSCWSVDALWWGVTRIFLLGTI